MTSSRYSSKITQIVNGVQIPVPGASVYIYQTTDEDSPLETLTDDASAPLANPVVTDRDGMFYFNALDGDKKMDIWFGGERKWREDIRVGQPAKGDPGGDATQIGTLFQAPDLTISSTINQVTVTGQDAVGDSGAGRTFVYDPSVNSAYVTANPRGAFISYNGRGFRRVSPTRYVNPAATVQDQNWITSLPGQARISSLMNASMISGGTGGFPNHIGMLTDIKRTVGNGTAIYTVTFPFVVVDYGTSWQVGANKRRILDNQLSPATITNVSGYNSNTITVTLSAPVDATYYVDIQAIGPEDSSANPRLIVVPGGYDNTVNQLMCVAIGAHHTINGPGNHNTIGGGSTCTIYGGNSYSYAAGYNVLLGFNAAGSTGMVGIGQNLQVDGRGAACFGQGNTVNGNGAFSAGETNLVSAAGGIALGNGNTASAANAMALGNANTSSATYAFAAGLSNAVSASYSVALGRSLTVSGGTAFATGYRHTVAHASSAFFGDNGVTRNVYERGFAFSPATQGDFQIVDSGMKGTTTDATLTNLTKTGGTAFTLGTDSVNSVDIVFVGKEVATGDVVVLDLKATVKVSSGGVASIVGGATATLRHSDAGLSTCAASIGVSGAGIVLKVQGVAAKTVKWGAFPRIGQLGAGA